MVLHNALTGTELHYPRGAAAATSGQIPVAQGDGTTSFEDQKYNIVITGRIDDISTAGSAWSVSNIAGNITRVDYVLHGAIATANAVVGVYLGGVKITESEKTVAYSGSAAGDTYGANITTNNTVAQGDAIEVKTDGGSTNAVALDYSIYIEES